MTNTVSRRRILRTGAIGSIAAAAAASAALTPSTAKASTTASWSTSVGSDTLGIGAATIHFSRTDAAPTSFALVATVKNSNGTVLKKYSLSVSDMDTTPASDVTISHYSSGVLRTSEVASWDATGLVNSTWNEGSYDSVGVHNWLIADSGWAGPSGGDVIAFTPIGPATSNCS